MKNLMPIDKWKETCSSSLMSTNKDAIVVNTDSASSNDIKGPVLESDMFSLYSLSPVASLHSSSASMDDELDLGIMVDDELVDIDMLASTIMDTAFQPSSATTSSMSSMTESERALERDRRKIVRQRNRNNNTTTTSLMEQGLIDNFGQVAASRALEQIVDELIDQELSNVINQNSLDERLIASNNNSYYLTNEPIWTNPNTIKTDFGSNLLMSSNNNSEISRSILKNSGRTPNSNTKKERKKNVKRTSKATTRTKLNETKTKFTMDPMTLNVNDNTILMPSNAITTMPNPTTKVADSRENLGTMNSTILDKLSTMNTTCTAVTKSMNTSNLLCTPTIRTNFMTSSACLETFASTSPKSFATTSKSSATSSRRRRSRKQYWERRRRDQFGFLISSLQRKTYHCNCYECQDKRKDDNKKPPIEVETIEVPQMWPLLEAERMKKPRGRGRPRKFPRIEDLIKHQQQNNNNEYDERSNNDENVSNLSKEGVVAKANLVEASDRL